MTSYGENASFVSLLGSTPVAEGASDASEPDVLKPKDASGHPEDSPPRASPLQVRGGELGVSNKFPGDAGTAGPWTRPLRTAASGHPTKDARPPSFVCASALIIARMSGGSPAHSPHKCRPRMRLFCCAFLRRLLCPLCGSVTVLGDQVPGHLPGREQIRFPAPSSVCLGRVRLRSHRPHFLV